MAVSLSVIFLFMLTMMFVNPRTKNFGSNLNSINGRTEIWKASIGVIKDNWLLGVGLDGETWAKKYNIYAESINARKDTPPHNMFLEIWGKSGIFAVLFFVLFLISCLYKNTKMFIQTGDYYFLLVTAFLSFAAIFAFVENMFLMDIRILAIIWMVLGLNPEDKSDKYQGKYYERI
ncbi:MAG: O-antigen ligase family protein [Elusimicrobia bacterium]|nr:O-antigen ligase family protein [Elusimicrobiota bacterium]